MPLEIGNPGVESEVVVGDHTYRVVGDIRTSYRVIVVGELTALPADEAWKGPINVSVDRRGLFVKRTRDGYFAVAAYPELAFPDLAASPYSFDLEVSAPGFRSVSATITAPAAATFPLPPLAFNLNPFPLTLSGRVVEAAGAGAPIAGALVRFADADVLALRTILHFDHAAGVVIRACNLNPAGAAKTLEERVRSGETTVALNDRQGLAAGDVLRFGDPINFEYGIIDSLAPDPANPALPGEATLTGPLVRSFGAAAAVQQISPAPQAGFALLDRAVFSGGGVLTLNADLAAGQVQIENTGSSELEFHDLGALSDFEGYFQLAGIDRPQKALAEASGAGFVTLNREFSPDFRARVNSLDFRLETP